MLNPEFSIERINTYGIHYDPYKHKLSKFDEKGAWSVCYEFNFFLDDWEGGPSVDGIHYPASKDHFLCCKPMQHKKSVGPYRCYILSISTQDPQLKAALDQLPTYTFHPELDKILALFMQMVHVDTRTTLDARLELSIYASSILRLLLRQHYSVAHTVDGNPRRHQAALLSANKYLQEHLEEDVNLEQLAQDSYLHPTYFHKLFTAAFGRTPSEQLKWHRIMASREYLRDDNWSISEIARKCGFSSQSYFCRVFKSYTSQTPSRYRSCIRRRRQK